jgi:hypothetical protein
LLLALGLGWWAQDGDAQPVGGLPTHSRSGQLVVSVAAGEPRAGVEPGGLGDSRLRTLTPDLLAVSCDRIRRDLLAYLRQPDRWQHKIHVRIHAGWPSTHAIPVTATAYRDGWRYAIEFPERMESEKVVRATVQALLWEIANREGRERSAEVPMWLTEGLTQQLLATAEMDPVLEPEAALARRGSVWSSRGRSQEGLMRDPLFEARRRLALEAPLTFEELSLPTPAQREGAGWEVYQSSAHLFVHELLRLEDGHARLAAMLRALPGYWNWQTALLRSFGRHFPTLLDLEKWWALAVTNFRRRDHWRALPEAVAAEHLAEVLTVPAGVRASTNDLPARTRLPLQRAVRELSFEHQRQALGHVVHELQALRPQLSAETAMLADGYQEVLRRYLEQRSAAGVAPQRRGEVAQRIRDLAERAVAAFDGLDERRARAEPRSESEGPRRVRQPAAPE